MATIFNSVTFYFFFGELPTKIKFFGMAFAITATVLLAVNASQQKGNTNVDNKEGGTT